jgi:membrane protein implicated in regulation of membrane protease activity
MQWWAWIAVGAILLGAELTIVNAQFYLVFIGSAALIVGLLSVAGIAGAPWLQWVAFAALAAVSMVGFRRRVYGRLRRNLPDVTRAPAGEHFTLAVALAPGETGRIDFRGTSWTVLNAGSASIPAGGRARIERVDGLTLVLKPSG